LNSIRKMSFTAEEREMKFRLFIKLRAKNASQSVIMRRVGMHLINCLQIIIIFFLFQGIKSMTTKNLSIQFHTMLADIVRQQQKMTRHWLRPLFTTIGPTLMNSKKHESWEITNGFNRLARQQFDAVLKNKVFRH